MTNIFSHDLGGIGAEILLSNHLNNYGACLKGRWGQQWHWHHRDTQNRWASTNSAHPLKQGICNASSGAHLLAQQHWRKVLVFAGSVLWTEKIHRTELNRTMVRSIFRLQLPKFGVILVAGCLISKIIQNRSKPCNDIYYLQFDLWFIKNG